MIRFKIRRQLYLAKIGGKQNKERKKERKISKIPSNNMMTAQAHIAMQIGAAVLRRRRG